MSLFNFTRQEQITILFLVLALLVGGVVTLIKRHHPGFAPELMIEEQNDSSVTESPIDTEILHQPISTDSLFVRKIDLNRADEEELMELPGIGPTLARLIVAYRDERGGFQTVEELKRVKGIGEKTFEQLKPLIKIE